MSGYWTVSEVKGSVALTYIDALASAAEVLAGDEEYAGPARKVLMRLFEDACEAVFDPKWVEVPEIDENEPEEVACDDCTAPQAAAPVGTVPSFEAVFGEGPAGLTREDFVRALVDAGYDSGPRGFMEFGLGNLEQMQPDARRAKMDFLVELAETNRRMTMPGAQGAPAQRSSGGTNLQICPSGEDHGESWQNTTREGKVYFKCREISCHRPGSDTVTTWDASNYGRRQEEFRTGVPYVPAKRYGSYSGGRRG